MKDALGHGSDAGWGAHPGATASGAQPGSKVAAKYQSLNGRTDAVVRTERMPDGYLWQHDKQHAKEIRTGGTGE